MAKYSLLTSDPSILRNPVFIGNMLESGIKVLAFSNKQTAVPLLEAFSKFEKEKLLQLFETAAPAPVLTIEDGNLKGKNEALKSLSKSAVGFNLEQYIIEHADPEACMIIEAGAGTGKTTVMIDRILFLLHVVPDLTPADIGMITFTNEATQNMKHKIQRALLGRFNATHSPRYLYLLENSSKIRIQTIHSFSKDIITELGTSVGYGHSVSLRSFKYDRDQMILDVLDGMFAGSGLSVKETLGLKLYDLKTAVSRFWTHMQNEGLSDEDILALDWGQPVDDASSPLHNVLKKIFAELNQRYSKLKLRSDAYEVGDIVRELDHILEASPTLKPKGLFLKYLFVDEFQDSDNSQIRTISWLQQHMKLKLFVVGDIKQSIYRFRGAVDTAFDKLRNLVGKHTPIIEFALVRNYRTSQDVLTPLDIVFRKWLAQDLLRYNTTLEPQQIFRGEFVNIMVIKSMRDKQLINTIREALQNCVEYGNRKAALNKDYDPDLDQTQRVTVLARTNQQLQELRKICEESKIPCYLRQVGSFYSSDAVRDFFSLIKAYLFSNSSRYLYDYIFSPYSPIPPSSLREKDSEDITQEKIQELLNQLQTNETWKNNLKQFRLKPVMSVLRKIVDTARPEQNYISSRKAVLLEKGNWEEKELNEQLLIEARQYAANTEKLFEILRTHFLGQMASLPQIYRFLQINTSTNVTEEEPDVSEQSGSACLHGLTVHRAKGLEFDTVILPYTDRQFFTDKSTSQELLLRETESGGYKVGWKYQASNTELQKNTWYDDCRQAENKDVSQEEARLLYVALTRSIRRLICFRTGDNENTWSVMLGV